MQSIFDLKTNVSELSSANQGTSKMSFNQHPPTRDVVGNNFSNGAIHVRWEVSGQEWFIPSRSYIRTRFQLTKGDGTPVSLASGIAPNMNLMSNLFQSAELRLNDKVVSRIADFMPQVEALKTRLQKSSSWIESIGKSTNWWETDQAIRMNQVSSDGTLLYNQVPGTTETVTTRTALGFDAAGTNLNNAGYEASTGIITFSQGTGGTALPADVRTVFPAGSYFRYTAGTTVATSSGILMKVITGQNGAPAGSTTTIVVEPILNQDEAGGTGAGVFEKVDIIDPVLAEGRRIGEFELTWTPPLSFFDINHAMPTGRYELVLNPCTQSSYQRYAIESVLGEVSKIPQLTGEAPDASKFKLNVVNMYFYTCNVEGPRCDNQTYLLDLQQYRIQSEKVQTADFQQVNFDVSPSTTALCVMYQDLRAGNNTAISRSKFKSYEDGATPTTAQELNLDRFYINYSGQNLPQPDADPHFVAGVDYTTQRYTESQIYSGAYFDSGGAENIQQYHDRGAYYHFAWPRKISHCVCCY